MISHLHRLGRVSAGVSHVLLNQRPSLGRIGISRQSIHHVVCCELLPVKQRWHLGRRPSFDTLSGLCGDGHSPAAPVRFSQVGRTRIAS